MWGAHVGALAALSGHRLVATHTPAPDFSDAMAAEHDAYRQLGPVLACFYDPGRSAVAPFTVPLTAAEHFEVSVAS